MLPDPKSATTVINTNGVLIQAETQKPIEFFFS